MTTPAMPQITVSQMGMLSLPPGAVNSPSSPMTMPATMTRWIFHDEPPSNAAAPRPPLSSSGTRSEPDERAAF